MTALLRYLYRVTKKKPTHPTILAALIPHTLCDHYQNVVGVTGPAESWRSAERRCGQHNERLAIFKNEEGLFDVQLRLTNFTDRNLATFWIGGREIKSQWVWSHGEYYMSTIYC